METADHHPYQSTATTSPLPLPENWGSRWRSGTVRSWWRQRWVPEGLSLVPRSQPAFVAVWKPKMALAWIRGLKRPQEFFFFVYLFVYHHGLIFCSCLQSILVHFEIYCATMNRQCKSLQVHLDHMGSKYFRSIWSGGSKKTLKYLGPGGPTISEGSKYVSTALKYMDQGELIFLCLWGGGGGPFFSWQAYPIGLGGRGVCVILSPLGSVMAIHNLDRQLAESTN